MTNASESVESHAAPEPLDGLPADVQARLDAHLDAVDAVLVRYGQSRAQRAAITDELDGQLRDMLAERCSGGEPTLADADAVLADVEPAEAFARRSVDLDAMPGTDYAGFADDTGPPPKTSGWAIAGLVFLLLGLSLVSLLLASTLALAFSLAVADQIPASTANPSSGGMPLSGGAVPRVGGLVMVVPMLLLPLALAVGATACGITAMGKIKQAPRHVGGWGLAVFDAMFFPFWVVSGLLCVLVWSGIYLGLQAVKLLSGKTNIFEDGMRPSTSSELNLVFLLALPLGVLLAACLTRTAVRRLNAWREGREVVRGERPIGLVCWFVFLSALACWILAVRLGPRGGEILMLLTMAISVVGVPLGAVLRRSAAAWLAGLLCGLLTLLCLFMLFM